MNLLEAIQNCGENWFRPVVMSKGYAFSHNGIVTFYQCPDKHLPEPDMTGDLFYLLGEWEIVTPEQVKAERK